jgi:choline-sulfatase
MARMKKTVAVLVFILTVAVLSFMLFVKPGGSNFRRLAFSSPGLKPLYPDTELTLPGQVKPDRPIARGQHLYFKESAVLTLSPEVRGMRGIFFTFQVEAVDSGDVRTAINLNRKGKQYKLKSYRGRKYYHSFVKELDLLKQDRISVELRGNGLVVINRPVIYRIIEREKRNHVFVIALDTLRHDRVGARRNNVELTPHISQFRRDCCDFTQAFAQSNWTLPSFMSFFTGLYEFNHQITRDSSLAADKPFLIDELSDKFFTVNYNAGLWLKGKFGFSRGFDLFSVLSSPKDSLGGQVLLNQTVDFLKRVHVPSLFMFLHTYQIHSPYAPPEKFLKQLCEHSEYTELDSYFYKKQFNKDVSPPIHRAMETLYDAEILAFDHFFGEFIRNLKELDIYDRSMIVFLSDHGEEFYEHQGWAHCHSLYNEVIQVPLYIKFPDFRYRGVKIGNNVGLIDVLPTIMDYFRVRSNPRIDGRNLMPLLNGGEWNRQQVMSSTSVGWLVRDIPPKLSIVRDRFKLIYNVRYSQENLNYFNAFGPPPPVDEIQLFNLEKDRSELAELSGKERIRRMNLFRTELNLMKKTIRDIMKKKRLKNVSLSEEEKEKLRSLGYL